MGYEGMKQHESTTPKSGGAELRIPEALDRLIKLSTGTDKPDEMRKRANPEAKSNPENK